MKPLDRFTCEDMFRKLDGYLDGSLSEEERARIREHLELCETCAREYRFEESLVAELKTKLQSTAVPKGLKNRISSLLEEAERRR